MYTVAKGPSKLVAKTRIGFTQNYEKFDSIKDLNKTKTNDSFALDNFNVPRPVFNVSKKMLQQRPPPEEEALTPQHEEIINYINDSWNMIVAHNPYDNINGSSDPNNNKESSTAASTESNQTHDLIYCVEPPSPVLTDFKPFDLESWWGRRLFVSITKNL